eukprot:CAMPEP_0179185186 /NCGR_PEP_ID=MMETSP0796-20121207/91826_1 /TAXON_ID=73915 /ORGANISM="Pyrodinium bahamense, Strain pbaha01" /LENGTH=222 /DNA_ID=CAMNT_0020889141 /DNA_START=80 /DNA_END=749 /DNA_ORIENTATION=+
MPKFQLMLDGEWKDYTAREQELLKQAFMDDKAGVAFHSRGQDYYCDLKEMVQRNASTGRERQIRAVCGDGEPKQQQQQRLPDSGRRPCGGRPNTSGDAAAALALQEQLDREQHGYAPIGYAPPPPYVQPPPYAQLGCAPQPLAYTQPTPTGGTGMGISPLTAGLAAGAAGLLGGMLLEEALDGPDVVVVEDGPGGGDPRKGANEWWGALQSFDALKGGSASA